MTNPWDGPRHRSWASNTMLAFYTLLACIVATVVSDVFGEPPNYLIGLLGTAAGAFFAAIGTDKQKKEADVEATARDAYQAAYDAQDRLDRAEEHPENEFGEQDRSRHERARRAAERGRVDAEKDRRAAERRRRGESTE